MLFLILLDYCSPRELRALAQTCRCYQREFCEATLSLRLARLIEPADRLRCFLATYAHLPAQGSEAWKVARRETIGGSEIGTMLGINPYQKIGDLAREKLGLSHFEGNLATCWGNLFEEEIARIMEFRLSAALWETGSIPGWRDERRRVVQTFSPDRLAVVKAAALKSAGIAPPTAQEELTVLFEFKCPIRRIPNGTVPAHYEAQPQLGLAVLPFVDFCLFVDAAFRRCSVGDFAAHSGYDRAFHRERSFACDTLYLGMVGFYLRTDLAPALSAEELAACLRGVEGMRQNPPSVYYRLPAGPDHLYSWMMLAWRQLPSAHCCAAALWQVLEALGVPARREQVVSFMRQLYSSSDVASVCVPEGDMEELIVRAREGEYGIYYPAGFCSPREGDAQLQRWLRREMRFFLDQCWLMGAVPAGVMPWKLLVCRETVVTRRPRFTEEVKPQVTAFMRTLRGITAASNLLDPQQRDDYRRQRVEELY